MSETKSEQLTKFQEPYDYKNSTFVKNLNQKFSQIKDKRIILFMKHLFLRRVVNAFQISIIIASTIITFFESLQNNLSLNENQIKTLAIFLSTYIAISTAVYKFIKIDDRKEEIYKVLQTFNDIENTIMNKIENIKLLQDKFSDEMKLNLKSPYIMNHKYNHISSHSDSSNNLTNEYEHECDEHPHVNQPQPQYYKYTNKIIEDCDVNSQSSENSELKQLKNKCNFNIYLLLLKKYETEFQNIIKGYEIEDIDMKILVATTHFDALLSYNEIIYYRGKIVETMLLEKVHENNRHILDISIEELQKCNDQIKKLRHKYNSEEDENKQEEYKKEILKLEQRAYDICQNNEFNYKYSCLNNFCLFFSNICKFCLIMKLYYGLGIRKNKIKMNIEEIQTNSKFVSDFDLENGITKTPRKKTSFLGKTEKKKQNKDSCCCCGSCIV